MTEYNKALIAYKNHNYELAAYYANLSIIFELDSKNMTFEALMNRNRISNHALFDFYYQMTGKMIHSLISSIWE